MGRVNYMGGKLSTVRARNKDATLRIQKSHFGKQRLRTLSDYLQAINNPVPPKAPDPISEIRLAHARRDSRRHQASSDPLSIPAKRYRSYIPSPSKVSSESSDSLDARRTLSAKLRASRKLLELARVDSASLDYQRKRLLEIPDFAGLAQRKQRVEAAQTRSPPSSQDHWSEATRAYSTDVDEPIITYSHDAVSDVSSLRCDVSEGSPESIYSWSERDRVYRDRLSPVSSIHSFSGSKASRVASFAISERNSDWKHTSPGMNANLENEDSDKENKYPPTEGPRTQFSTSDSAGFSRAKKRITHCSDENIWNASSFIDPNDISLSDEWLAFSKLLDTSLTRGFKLPGLGNLSQELVVQSDSLLGLDFHVIPHLLSDRFPRQIEAKNTYPEKHPIHVVAELPTEDANVSDTKTENIYPAYSNSPFTITAQDMIAPDKLTSNQCTHALSDISSILLSCIPSKSPSGLGSQPNLNDQDTELAAGTNDVKQHQHRQDNSHSRTQWDELMDELLEPALLPHTARVFSSDSNIPNGSDLANSHVSSPFRPLEIGSSDDYGAAAAQAAKSSNISVMGSGKSEKNEDSLSVNQTECTPETLAGPILFAFTFTSDVDEE